MRCMTKTTSFAAFLDGHAEVRMMVTRCALRVQAAGLCDREVAGILGIAASQWAALRDRGDAVLSRREERGVRQLGDLIGFAGMLLGSDEAVASWLRSPCAAIGERPLELLIRDGGSLAWMRGELEREYVEGGAL